MSEAWQRWPEVGAGRHMTKLYVFRGRCPGGLSYDEANGLTAEGDSNIWLLNSNVGEDESIWDSANAPESVKRWRAYQKAIGGPIHEATECNFCNSAIASYCLHEVFYTNPKTGDEVASGTDILVCYQCGWYRRERTTSLTILALPAIDSEVACLERREISDDTVPLEALRAHLARHWGDRKHISPGQAERLVADIFREHLDGEVLYTTNGVYTPDGGIDFVIVCSERGVASAFQIKRRQTDSAESVTEVRSFLGALAGSPFSQGYFVTTAPSFTRTAIEEGVKARANLRSRGLSLEIVDGTALHRILLSQTGRPSLAALCDGVRDYERVGKWAVIQGEGMGQEVSFDNIVMR
jgi:hypothetical protein